MLAAATAVMEVLATRVAIKVSTRVVVMEVLATMAKMEVLDMTAVMRC